MIVDQLYVWYIIILKVDTYFNNNKNIYVYIIKNKMFTLRCFFFNFVISVLYSNTLKFNKLLILKMYDCSLKKSLRNVYQMH